MSVAHNLLGQGHQQSTLNDTGADIDTDLLHDSVTSCGDFDFHFHRRDCGEDISAGHLLPYFDEDLLDGSRHGTIELRQAERRRRSPGDLIGIPCRGHSAFKDKGAACVLYDSYLLDPVHGVDEVSATVLERGDSLQRHSHLAELTRLRGAAISGEQIGWLRRHSKDGRGDGQSEGLAGNHAVEIDRAGKVADDVASFSGQTFHVIAEDLRAAVPSDNHQRGADLWIHQRAHAILLGEAHVRPLSHQGRKILMKIHGGKSKACTTQRRNKTRSLPARTVRFASPLRTAFSMTEGKPL
jgi:hypothetical protein